MRMILATGQKVHFTFSEFLKAATTPASIATLASAVALCVLIVYSTGLVFGNVLWQIATVAIGVPFFIYCYLANLLLLEKLRECMKIAAIPEASVMFMTVLFASLAFSALSNASAVQNPEFWAMFLKLKILGFALLELFATFFYVFVFPKQLEKIRALRNERKHMLRHGGPRMITIGSHEFLLDDIRSVSAQDHYLRICTTDKQFVVFGRISDFERDAQKLGVRDGALIHRSHWIRLDKVSEFLREGGKIFALMDEGQKFPVARSHAKRVESFIQKQENGL